MSNNGYVQEGNIEEAKSLVEVMDEHRIKAGYGSSEKLFHFSIPNIVADGCAAADNPAILVEHWTAGDKPNCISVMLEDRYIFWIGGTLLHSEVVNVPNDESELRWWGLELAKAATKCSLDPLVQSYFEVSQESFESFEDYCRLQVLRELAPNAIAAVAKLKTGEDLNEAEEDFMEAFSYQVGLTD